MANYRGINARNPAAMGTVSCTTGHETSKVWALNLQKLRLQDVEHIFLVNRVVLQVVAPLKLMRK